MTKTVLITGASSGFGEACAYELAQHGYTLILVSRNTKKLDAIKNKLAASIKVHCVTCDVTDSNSVQNMFKALPKEFKDIDVLINNAGLALGMVPAYDADLNDWETMINTNVTGLVRVTHAVLKGMVERNRGQIINIGSVAGNWAYPGGGTYGGTKAFVQNFSRGLRADLLGKKIRVTNLEPGMAKTNFSNVRFKGDDEKANSVYEGTEPLSAQDIANTLRWLIELPEHVNVNTMEMMPTCQAWGPFAVSRDML